MKPEVLRNKFPLAHLLLKFWDRFESKNGWIGNETMALVKCDSAREQKGIPSFLG